MKKNTRLIIIIAVIAALIAAGVGVGMYIAGSDLFGEEYQAEALAMQIQSDRLPFPLKTAEIK